MNKNSKSKKTRCLVRNLVFLFSIFYFLFSISYFLFPASPAYAVTSSDLIEYASQYDGKIVSYKGEVIGDIMRRGNYAWLNVWDGENAIGVWAKGREVEKIKYIGAYGYVGDQVEVVGVFHRACQEHGGDLDIHAQGISILSPGKKIAYPINMKRVAIAGILALVTLMLLLRLVFCRPKPELPPPTVKL